MVSEGRLHEFAYKRKFKLVAISIISLYCALLSNPFHQAIQVKEFYMLNIKNKREFIFSPLLAYIIILFLILVFPIFCNAQDVERRGDAYIIYLSGKLNFNEVVSSLENELVNENWQVGDHLDIGAAVKEFGKQTENKVLSVCKTQYLARAIEEDPFISLIIPCRFTVFRESTKKTQQGRIVVGFYDPVAEANGIGLKQAQAAEIAKNELKAVLNIGYDETQAKTIDLARYATNDPVKGNQSFVRGPDNKKQFQIFNI